MNLFDIADRIVKSYGYRNRFGVLGFLTWGIGCQRGETAQFLHGLGHISGQKVEKLRFSFCAVPNLHYLCLIYGILSRAIEDYKRLNKRI